MLGNRIRLLRDESGLNQQEMGELLGLTQSAYSKYETGENQMSADTLRKLAIMYDVSGDFLLGLTNEMKVYERCSTPDMDYRSKYLKMRWEKKRK